MRRTICLFVLGFAIAALGSWVNLAYAGDVKLTWTAPDACADGSALTNCPTAGFEVSQGASETAPLTVKETVSAGTNQRTYAGLAPGKYCYALRTVASNAAKSDSTTTVCATIPFLPPKAPQNFSVTVQVTTTVTTAPAPTP